MPKRILGAAPAVAIVLSAALSCGGGGSQPSGQATPRPRVSAAPSATPTPGTPAAVWVLSTVGLKLHDGPGGTAQTLAVIGWGQRLDVVESQNVAADTWYHVKTAGGSEGWVISAVQGEPTVAARAMSVNIDDQGLYRNLFPADWSLQKGNPTVFTAPASDPEKQSFLIQTAADAAHLPPSPINAGKALRDVAGVEVYGQTSHYTIYQLDQGGFEFDLRLQHGAAAYLFEFTEAARSRPDTGLYETLLGAVIVGSP